MSSGTSSLSSGLDTYGSFMGNDTSTTSSASAPSTSTSSFNDMYNKYGGAVGAGFKKYGSDMNSMAASNIGEWLQTPAGKASLGDLKQRTSASYVLPLEEFSAGYQSRKQKQ